MQDGPVQTLDISFRLRERDGTVHSEVVPNTDPKDLGHPLVAVGYDEDLFRGFPCITGTIAYAGSGPRAWMGWVQVIERRDVEGTVTIEVDLAPVFAAGSPLYAFGYLPTFSDFPANPDHPNGDWVAATFLLAIPNVVRSCCAGAPWRRFPAATSCGTAVRQACSRRSNFGSRLGMPVGTCSRIGTRIGRSNRAVHGSDSCPEACLVRTSVVGVESDGKTRRDGRTRISDIL